MTSRSRCVLGNDSVISRQALSPEMPVDAGLRILLVEDSPTDAELIVHRLHKNGLDFTHKRVETADLLVRALTEFDPDILLCDNRLPNLDAVGVMEIVVAMRPHLPIIIVTGTLEDESAAGLIKAGASDFIRKDRLGRLPVAVTSTVEVARVQRIRREQEAKLRESELMLRLALGATDQGVWRWEVDRGADGFEWDAPCSALLGLAFHTPMNFAVWANAIHPTDRVAALAGMDLALDPANRLDDYVCDFRVVRGVDPEIWFAATGRAVFEPDPAGPAGRKPVRVLGTIRDVSGAKVIEQEREATRHELERAREAAEQASQAKSRFLAGVSHELRTPLHGILGYSELLIMEGGLNTAQLQRLRAMITAGKHLLGMINAVLDVTQIEADRLELFPVEIELTGLVCDCLDVIRPEAEAKRLGLVLTPAAPLRLVADPTRLRQVLINLLGNAVKFTPAGAVEVRLRASDAGDRVRIKVADTGPGVWARHRDKLFQTFERLNAKTLSGTEGVGLGLALAARLVRLMGGEIGYEDNPGGGSVFWLELPRGPVSSAAAEAVAPLSVARRTPLRVLVADDEAMNRDIACVFLTRAGHQVVAVDNGAAAVAAAATKDFDAILMDVRMPGMDGLEATRRIRALPAPHGGVPILAVTAQAFAQQIETCRQAGVDGHVSKPFKQAELLVALEKAAVAGPVVIAPAATFAEDAEFPVFDRTGLEEISACMPAADVAANLQKLLGRSESLLSGLRMPDIPSRAGELAEAAHSLAGAAGMFGFLFMAAAARQFEHADDAGAPDAPVLADGLSAAIEASLATMRECIGRTVAA